MIVVIFLCIILSTNIIPPERTRTCRVEQRPSQHKYSNGDFLVAVDRSHVLAIFHAWQL